jgi:hypothetical protein
MCTARHSDTQTPWAADLSADENPDKSAHRRRGLSTEFRASLSQNTRGLDDASKASLLCSLIQRLAGSVGDIMHTKFTAVTLVLTKELNAWMLDD